MPFQIYSADSKPLLLSPSHCWGLLSNDYELALGDFADELLVGVGGAGAQQFSDESEETVFACPLLQVRPLRLPMPDPLHECGYVGLVRELCLLWLSPLKAPIVGALIGLALLEA